MNIFIDLDGTLVDSSDRHYQVYKDIIKGMGGVPMPKDVYWELIRDKAAKDIILEKSGVASTRNEEYLEQFVKNIELDENLKFEKLIDQDVLTVLEMIKQKHNLILITLRKNKPGAENQIKALGIDKFFKHIIICDQEKSISIKPYLSDLDENVMVGDTEADIEAAKKLGIRSVGLLSGFRNERLMRSFKPDYICSSIKDLVKVLDL